MMKNKGLERQISEEILSFLEHRKSLMLSSLDEHDQPYASYAPYGVGEECLYILISEIAVHAKNLQHHSHACVLIIQDETEAEDIFARLRLSYQVNAELLAYESEAWQQGIAVLNERFGERIEFLSQMSDFKLFRLVPEGGRFVKGFGKAYQLEGGSLCGEHLSHLRGQHQQRD